MVNIKAAFQGYKNIQVKYLSMATPCKKTEKHFCRLCHDYFRKQNRPLNDVRNRQQCWCFSDFLEATVTRAEGENISATKFFVYGLEQNYLTEKKLLKLEPVFRMKSQLPHLKYPFKLLLLFSRVERSISVSPPDADLILKDAGADGLPSYCKLDDFRKERRPEVKKKEEPFHGIKYDYIESLKITTSQLLKSLELPNLQG